VMTPINDNKTFLDLAVELQIPTLLVSANYLGAISHTLSAVKALDLSGVVVEKIIINENSPLFKTQENSIIETIKNFTLKDVVLLSDFFKKFS